MGLLSLLEWPRILWIVNASLFGIAAWLYFKRQKLDRQLEKNLALELSKLPKISRASLTKYDGSDSSLPIYVAIKGKVFDVSSKREVYGPGGSYHVFAGKEPNRGLAMSSLKPEDMLPSTSGLTEKQLATLDSWEVFFKKRYPIVALVEG